MNLKETELCLGLPGGVAEATTVRIVGGKRAFEETSEVELKLNLQVLPNNVHESSVNLNKETMLMNNSYSKEIKDDAKPPAKAQVVGWPPVRSYRKNIISHKVAIADVADKNDGNNNIGSATFVKVSMDGAPYLRKVDLKMYKTYKELSDALAQMFNSFTMGNSSYGAQGMIDFMNERKLMDLLNSSEYVPSYEDKDGDWMLVGDVPWEMFVGSCKRMRIMKGSEAIGLAPRAMEKCKSRT